MFDLGTSFLASVLRDPNTLAIVDEDVRLTYREWYYKISAIVQKLDDLGLSNGDHILVVMQNRWEYASLHWACQFRGIVVTPLNWRAKYDEIDYAITDSNAKAVFYEDSTSEAVKASVEAAKIPNICTLQLNEIMHSASSEAEPSASAEDWSLMLYTSGTTSKPKGVPRRHRAERAGALAHVAQNLYRNGEITLGVMPLYHTMGVRSLIASSLTGGTFICLPRFDAAKAIKLIESEKITNLYLVPTLYHDVVHHPEFSPQRVKSVTKLGYAGASMTDGLLKKLNETFKPELFVNHYGSSEIYTFTIDQKAAAKPGSAGRSGINQMIQVVKLGAESHTDKANIREEGEIIASLKGDEAFEGYWNRPEADAKSLKDGWYFTGDTGFFDEDGDLFVTGRVDDMIITGGENVSPVEVESFLSLHPNITEVAVVGLQDERWGQLVTAFIKRSGNITVEQIDQYCKESKLANFRRPRKFIFVESIPKSPVGKVLRRMLVAGDYTPE